MSSKFWVVAKDKRGELYVFNDGYYNTKEEAEKYGVVQPNEIRTFNHLHLEYKTLCAI